MATEVLVLGGNFGGLTAAIDLKRRLGDEANVTVVSKANGFLFNPSLIWMPFGKRSIQDITFPLAPTFERRGVHFVHAAATAIDAGAKRVHAGGRDFDYDYLVVATGYVNDDDVVPGLGPDGHAQSITTVWGAMRAAEAWEPFAADPGPIVVAATQGAACFGAAYEFLLNAAYQVKRLGIRDRAPITLVTAEPFLGHFGIGGMTGGERMLKLFLDHLDIEAIPNMAVESVDEAAVRLADGRTLESRFSMVVPPFLGAEVVRDSGLGNAKGFVDVHDTYQSTVDENVYAVGVGAAVQAPWHTSYPIGVPKTGFPTETMAKTAAANIAARVRGEVSEERHAFGEIPAVCIMDAGNNGVLILGDHMLPPRRAAVMIPGPQVHLAKLAFERYFLWKSRNGLVQLP
jgi:sulfide:quinone oxidoreductase